MLGAGPRCKVAPRLPHTHWAPAGLVSSLSEIFLLPERKKNLLNKTPENPKAIRCRPWSISGTGPLENPLAFQVGICVVAAKALGVLAHIAAFWTGLW